MSLDHTWLKGVPMELRPRYYPKPPLRFKDIDIYIPLDAIENDYDFTEERRVLAECKMWEEDKEKERLAEEERQRQAEEERLRLEEERIRQLQEEQERLEKGYAEDSSDQEVSSISAEVSKLDLAGEDANNKAEDENNIVPNTKESPSEDTIPPLSSSPSSQALPPVTHTESKTVVPQNGYHYNISDNTNCIQMPIYTPHHQQHPHPNQPPVQSYYNYYGPPHPPNVSMAMGPPYPEYSPQVQYHPHQSNLVSGGGGGGNVSILQPTPTIQPTSAPPSCSTGGEPNSSSASNSPAGSEKNLSTASTSAPRKVDLNLSDFESDTANPFDNVELKSINDMEVLAAVLNRNNVTTTTATGLPQHQVPVPNSSQVSAGSSYVNGVSPTLCGGYYHQPTPIYPPVSQQQQCPYPTWNQQNGYYNNQAPCSTPSSSAIVTSSIAPPQTSTGGSGSGHHNVPSPTQQLDQQQTSSQIPPPSQTTEGANSFTKLHFPFLTSMAASRATRDRERDNWSSSHYNRSFLPQSSSDDITSQNPFLASYIQPVAPPLSHSPMQHQHQYWPSHLSHQQQPPQQQTPFCTVTPTHNGPVSNNTPPAPTSLGGSAGFMATGPTGSQHALR